MSIIKDFYELYANNENFVEVVRCKDCKYYDESFCQKHDELIEPMEFCSMGERTDE